MGFRGPRDVQDGGDFLPLPRQAARTRQASSSAVPAKTSWGPLASAHGASPGSQLSLEGKQPQRPGACSCWRAPRAGTESSRGLRPRCLPPSLEGFRGREGGLGLFLPRHVQLSPETHNFQDASRDRSWGPSAPRGGSRRDWAALSRGSASRGHADRCSVAGPEAPAGKARGGSTHRKKSFLQ